MKNLIVILNPAAALAVLVLYSSSGCQSTPAYSESESKEQAEPAIPSEGPEEAFREDVVAEGPDDVNLPEIITKQRRLIRALQVRLRQLDPAATGGMFPAEPLTTSARYTSRQLSRIRDKQQGLIESLRKRISELTQQSR